ncbi:hypothetical protein ACFVYA_33865 [Amycolatopsis sp. NPDC058278]|uniref:hypothetical protein n=1 Tax=Amycolatopsis sp. NPDC058278 TaxID=3346417 RepID=UPI0036DDC681
MPGSFTFSYPDTAERRAKLGLRAALNAPLVADMALAADTTQTHVRRLRCGPFAVAVIRSDGAVVPGVPTAPPERISPLHRDPSPRTVTKPGVPSAAETSGRADARPSAEPSKRP